MRGWTKRWIAMLAIASASALAAPMAAGQAAPGDGAVTFASGLAVVEAEDHDVRAARSSRGWATVAGPSGLVGSAIQALPDSGARTTTSIATASPGLAFDPAATAGNLVLWVSHGTPGFDSEPDSSGEITRLSGPALGTLPDRSWRGIAYDVGTHQSPSGIIEYRRGAFDGALRGALIVARTPRATT